MLSSQARVLGEFLVERHVLSRDDLAIAMAESRRTGDALPAVLRAEGLVSEKDLTAAIAETVGVRFVDFTETPLSPDAALTVPEGVAREYQAIGVDFDGARLVVAFPDPGDDAAVQAVGQATGYEIVPAAAGRYEIQHAIDAVFGPAVPLLDPTGQRDANPVEDEVEGIHVNDLLKKVLEQRGSDLHLTAGSPPVIRVHGELQPVVGIDPLSGSQIREMIYAILTQKRAREVRERARARLLLFAPRPEPVPDQCVPPARQRRCGHAGHPVRDRRRSTTWACRPPSAPSPSCRVA